MEKKKVQKKKVAPKKKPQPQSQTSLKKSEGQEQRVSQVVRVVLPETPKPKRRRARRQVQSAGGVSAKQLMPVFIQPPVASQYYIPPTPSQPMDQMPQAIAVPVDSIFEDLKVKAEPLFKTRKEAMEDIQYIEPVPVARPEENLVKEAYGVFFKSDFKDKALEEDLKEFAKPTLAKVDSTPTNYEVSSNRDVIGITQSKKPTTQEDTMTEISAITMPTKRSKPSNIGNIETTEMSKTESLYSRAKSKGMKMSAKDARKIISIAEKIPLSQVPKKYGTLEDVKRTALDYVSQ